MKKEAFKRQHSVLEPGDMLHCHCVGCGGLTDHTMSRMIPVARFKEFVHTRCAPSQFHYSAVLAMPEEDSARICTHCVNWRRRCARGGKRHGSFTPMDSVLLFVMEPGTVPVPDRRSFERIVLSLQDERNLFAGLIPAPARSILGAPGTDARPDAIVARWWAEKGRTPFFRSSGTARIVRQCARRARAE